MYRDGRQLCKMVVPRLIEQDGIIISQQANTSFKQMCKGALKMDQVAEMVNSDRGTA